MYANTPMNHRMSTLPQPVLEKDITPRGDDYTVVRRVIEKISLDYREQPSLEDLAEAVGETPTGLQKLFTRWVSSLWSNCHGLWIPPEAGISRSLMTGRR